jgi:hypothetical protein
MVIRANPMYGKKWLNYILFLNARGSFHTQNWAYIHTEVLTGEAGVGRLYRRKAIQKSSLERMVLEGYTEVLTGEAGVGRLYRSPHWRGWCWRAIQKSSLERLVLEAGGLTIQNTEVLTGEAGVGRNSEPCLVHYTEVLTEEDGVGRNSKPCLVYTLEGTLNQYLLSEVLTIRVGLCT